jgi:hypothetical protein
MLTFGTFLKMTELAQSFGATLFHGKSYALISKKKWVGFGRLFHKLIWSPCMLRCDAQNRVQDIN